MTALPKCRRLYPSLHGLPFMNPSEVLTFLSASLAFFGVLLGLLTIAIFGLADKVATYRTESEELSKHLTEIGKFFEAKPEELSQLAALPKAVEEAGKLLLGLMRLTVGTVAVFSVGVGLGMELLIAVSGLSSDDLGIVLIVAGTGFVFVTILTVVLVLEVINTSESFGKMHLALNKLQSGQIRLEKGGKEEVYRPGEVWDRNIIDRGYL